MSQQASDQTKTKEEKTVVVPEKFKGLVDQLEKLSVLEMAELVKVLEEKFGVSATPVMVAGAAGTAGAAEGAAQEEKTSFDVELTEVGSNKIAVIKVVREATGKGLKDAKDLVEAAPKVILEAAPKEKAEELKKKIEEVGGKAVLK